MQAIGPVWDPVQNHGKSGLGSNGPLGSIFNDNSTNGRCHKLCSYNILIDISFVEIKCDSPRNRQVFMFMILDVFQVTNTCVGGLRNADDSFNGFDRIFKNSLREIRFKN